MPPVCVLPPLLIISNEQIRPQIESKVSPPVLQFFSCSDKISPSYSCRNCNFVTNFKTNLLYHIKRVHFVKSKNVKSTFSIYKCNNCKFCTCSLLILLKHIRIRCGTKK